VRKVTYHLIIATVIILKFVIYFASDSANQFAIGK